MRKIRWGVMGTADIAHGATIPSMQRAENCELYAIAGRSLEKAQQFQAEFGFQKAYEGYETLLQDPEVEAVYIPLPNNLHAEWSIRALEAGKHVLCEKPLTVSEADARRMFETAEAHHVILMEGFAYLHNPVLDAIRAELDAGAIGKILYLDAAFIGGIRPETNIRMRRETYGGSFYDLGCYPLSMVLWMLDEEPAQVKAAARLSNQHVDMETSAILLFDSGIIVNVECAMAAFNGRLERFQVLGTEGVLQTPMHFNQWGEIPYSITRKRQTETKTVFSPNNYQLEFEQMGRCILGLENPRIPAEFSIRCARTTDRILKEIGY